MGNSMVRLVNFFLYGKKSYEQKRNAGIFLKIHFFYVIVF